MNSSKNTVSPAQTLWNKVPEVTFFFWLIKIMCTTVGETAADFLNVNLNLGLTGTSVVTGVLLAIVLFFQLRAKKYTPALYWITVMLVSVFGTLVTDNLTDRLGIPLQLSTIFFTIVLASVFSIWYFSEKTLSIHSVFTLKRELFYWLAILSTFALGTATGDLMAEGLGLGYATTGLIIAAFIVLFAIGWKLKLNSILSFWLIYILTRPLGASIGDYLSQSPQNGGLGLGATMTSVLFVGGILAVVTYLSATKLDARKKVTEESSEDQPGALGQTFVILALLIITGVTGYYGRQSVLQSANTPQVSGANNAGVNTSSVPTSPLGDLTTFQTITQDTLNLLKTGDQAGATKRIGDLEFAWDNGQAILKPKDQKKWTEIDGKVDTVLRELRAVNPNSATEKTALEDLLTTLK